MPICSHCGNSHPVNARFCPKTGQALEISEQHVLVPTAVSPEKLSTVAPNESQFPTPEKRVKLVNPLYLLIAAGILIVLIGMIVIFFSLINNSHPISEVTNGISASSDFVATETETREVETQETSILPINSNTYPALTPSPELTLIATLSPEPTLSEFVTQVNARDQAVLVFVPAGKFIMGSDPEEDPYFWGAESPQHEVTLSDYWIYQTEVTNAMYQQCTKEKACPLPSQKKSRLVENYYDNSQYGNYPVIYVNWVSAQSYCQWAGGRLPTEAEWEKAARGDQDTRLFPWGNTPATSAQANFCDTGCAQTQADQDKNDGYPNTAPVGSYPEGISSFGVLDMAGNVWEWVFDWFQPTYSSSPVENPVGPASSKYRTIRGGSWFNPAEGVRIVQRDGVRPDLSLETLGFRCVVEVLP